MLSAIDILSTIQEQKTCHISKLAKELEIQLDDLKTVLINLSKYDLVDYNPKTGEVHCLRGLETLTNKLKR